MDSPLQQISWVFYMTFERECTLFGMCLFWNVPFLECALFWYVLCLECALFRMCSFWNVPYLECALLGMCLFWNMPFLECALFGMCPVWNCSFWNCSFWNVKKIEIENVLFYEYALIWMWSNVTRMKYAISGTFPIWNIPSFGIYPLWITYVHFRMCYFWNVPSFECAFFGVGPFWNVFCLNSV